MTLADRLHGTKVASETCTVRSSTVLRISVIIPALNEQRNIAGAIASARDAGAHEVIVVDGGSDDDTLRISGEMADRVESTSAGRAAQQNYGGKIATGDVLLFLHADCRLPSSSLKEVRQVLSESDDIVTGCFQQRIDAVGGLYRAIEAGNLLRARLLRWAYGDQAIFVRMNTFREVDGFPDVPIMEDLLLMKRLKGHGKMVVLNGRLGVSARRWQHRGVVKQTLRNWAMLIACHLGVAPARLRTFYPNDR